MSIRIETLQQLQNPTLLEKVLDRLRRTTQPRQFAYKKRCKVIGDKPLLLTALYLIFYRNVFQNYYR